MVDGLLKKHYRRRSILQAFVAIVIFVSGIIAGSGGTLFTLKNKGILRPLKRPQSSEIAREIGADYDLSEVQIQQVEQIFEKAGQYLETLRQDFDSKLEIGKEEILHQMKTVLPPEKYEPWLADFNARHHRRAPGPDS